MVSSSTLSSSFLTTRSDTVFATSDHTEHLTGKKQLDAEEYDASHRPAGESGEELVEDEQSDGEVGMEEGRFFLHEWSFHNKTNLVSLRAMGSRCFRSVIAASLCRSMNQDYQNTDRHCMGRFEN